MEKRIALYVCMIILILVLGCSKSSTNENLGSNSKGMVAEPKQVKKNKVQKVVYITDGALSTSTKNYILTCKDSCSENAGDINSFINQGWTIVSSAPKQTFPFETCICSGTEYLLEGDSNLVAESHKKNTPASAPLSEVNDLINQQKVLNGKCRGGSGGNPDTMKACDERDVVVSKLQAHGWCFGKEGQSEYQMEWHQCVADSTR